MAEYRWNVRILLKSIDDIKLLDENACSFRMRSLYLYSPLAESYPTLPYLKFTVTAEDTDVEGYLVAGELQEYFDLLLLLQGSAYCPDLLQ